MGDLNIRFTALGGEKNTEHSGLSTDSLDLKINNGVLERVTEEKPLAPVESIEEIAKDEYFQNLFEQPSVDEPQESVSTSLADEIFEEITSEIEELEETESTISDDEPSVDEPQEGISTSLADEIFEEITSKIEELEEIENTLSDDEPSIDEPQESISTSLADEIFEEITSEIEELEETESTLSDDEPDFSSEKEIITSANEILNDKSTADEVLTGLSQATTKDKYDFLNLCVMAVVILFLGLTFVFMKQSTNDDGVKFSLETLKTGEFTQYLGESFTEKMPLEKTMTQANVLFKKLFGKTDLKFVKFESTEPPNGPLTDDDMGGISAGDSLSPETPTTTTSNATAQVTTTPKLPQNFEISTPEETDESSGVFTGRPIKTTTTRVTTTLKLPETTDETTTGKVNLILP